MRMEFHRFIPLTAAARFAGSTSFLWGLTWGLRPRLYAAARFAGSTLDSIETLNPLAFKRGAVPLCEVRAGFVGALAEVEQRCVGIGRGAHVVVQH